MQTPALLIILIVTASLWTSAQPLSPKDSLGLAFSTYLGGKTFEQIRDITADRWGNVYVTGGTQSRDFPTTPGAYDRMFAEGGSSLGSSGPMDIFVVKYSASGELLWSTLLGGPNYDRAYAIEVDDSGYVYLGGRAGEGFPTTPGTLQPAFGGDVSSSGAYGKQDGFLAKLSPDGSTLVWATYFGRNDGGIIRDIVIDDSSNIYLVQPGVTGAHPLVTSNAFQKNFAGGVDVVVAKVNRDATRVVWATYFGGSGDDGGGPSIRLDPQNDVYILCTTTSPDLPTTSQAFDTSYNGGANDCFVAKFSSDGATLLYATYLGGSGSEGVETHNLAVDRDGNAYVSAGTTSTDFPTTPRALFRQHRGGNGDSFISKFSADGTRLLASTYVGGSSGDFCQGIYVDGDQNVIIGGNTQSADFPVTQNAYQMTHGSAGRGDFFLFKAGRDLDRILYSTFLGGTLADDGRTLWGDEKGNVYIAGQTLSRSFPVKNAAQPLLADTAGRDDGCLAVFSPVGNLTRADRIGSIRTFFRLVQNHPNPFAERTAIALDPGVFGRTALSRPPNRCSFKVFDCFGREVLDLSDRVGSSTSLIIDGRQLPGPGTYIYQLRYNDVVETGIMTLIR